MKASSSPRLLMFDLDGTLIDSRADLTTAVNLMRDHYGLPALPGDTVAGFIGDGIHKLVERALQGTLIDVSEAVKVTAGHYREHMLDRTTLYPGVEEGLRRLNGAGHRLALISNKPSAFCGELLAHFGVAECFQLVLGGDDTAHRKPHPEPLQKAMRHFSMPPQQSWMIGDYAIDLQAARQAGCKSVFVTYGIGSIGQEAPDLIFTSFAELTRHFSRA